jgi:fatty acid desaturase
MVIAVTRSASLKDTEDDSSSDFSRRGNKKMLWTILVVLLVLWLLGLIGHVGGSFIHLLLLIALVILVLNLLTGRRTAV